jgi:hypothetical protein
MRISRRSLSLGLFVMTICAVAACGDDGGGVDPPLPDGPAGCDPATVLPSNYRPIPNVSAGMVENVVMNGAVTTANLDARAGGLMGAPDNPYIYIDLKTGMKVAVNDLDARTSMTWDIALKRASVRINGGDSGRGGRQLATVAAADLAAVTAAPASGYAADDFADENCALVTLRAGEPSSAFGEWYNYDDQMHTLDPKAEVYVIERPDGSHTALRIVEYYMTPATFMGGGYYQVEWKQL